MQYLYFPRQDSVILAGILPVGNAEGAARIITTKDGLRLTVCWCVGDDYTIVKSFDTNQLDEYDRYFRLLAKELGAKNVDVL